MCYNKILCHKYNYVDKAISHSTLCDNRLKRIQGKKYIFRHLHAFFCLFFFGITILNHPLFSQKTIIKGIYQGENLYIQNPFGPNGVGFCVTQVSVNGMNTNYSIQSSAFEVDFDIFNFNFGDSLTIELTHKKNCMPIALNLDAIRPRSSFEIVSMRYDPDKQKLTWTTKGEISSIPFIVEQFRWKKWIEVATVAGKGTVQQHDYSAKVTIHSGKNIFRVKQIDASKQARYSEEIIYHSPLPVVNFSFVKATKIIQFSNATEYGIFNAYGNLLLKGRGKYVDLGELKEGDYFLRYDNDTQTITKKK